MAFGFCASYAAPLLPSSLLIAQTNGSITLGSSVSTLEKKTPHEHLPLENSPWAFPASDTNLYVLPILFDRISDKTMIQHTHREFEVKLTSLCLATKKVSRYGVQRQAASAMLPCSTPLTLFYKQQFKLSVAEPFPRTRNMLSSQQLDSYYSSDSK